MDAQELLTYIEDLTFKKSMRGYDANEVDDQLDRICDEIEAIARDKDAEIASLRKSVELSAKGTVSQELAKTKAKLAEVSKKLAEAEEKAFQAEAKLAAAEKQVEDDIRATEAEVAPIVNTVEADAQEAYKQYVRNADLLCRQLDALDAKETEIIEKARKEADEIVHKARADAESIIGKANIDAEILLKEAEANKTAFEALAEQRDDILAKLKAIAEDTGALVDKHIEKAEAAAEELLSEEYEEEDEDEEEDASESDTEE